MTKQLFLQGIVDRAQYLYRLALVDLNNYRKPSVFILGAQKSGTTSIFNYLIQHPQVFGGVSKEIGFFSDEMKYSKGVRWYHSHFVGKNDGLTIDATPEYLYSSSCPERIARYDFNSKFIIILRDPVKRAYSAWNMYRQFGSDNNIYNKKFLSKLYKSNLSLFNRFYAGSFPCFASVVDKGLNDIVRTGEDDFGILSRGMYLKQISRYLDFFDKRQFYFLEFSELKDNTFCALSDLTNFLNLEYYDWKLKLVRKIGNKRSYMQPIDTEIKELLSSFYQPYNTKLFRFLNRKYEWT